VERQCQLAEVSRAGFYRYLQQSTPAQADLLLRARLQELAVELRRLRGYRLLTESLRREGHVVNHKRVLRLMREDNLLCLRRTSMCSRRIPGMICRSIAAGNYTRENLNVIVCWKSTRRAVLIDNNTDAEIAKALRFAADIRTSERLAVEI